MKMLTRLLCAGLTMALCVVPVWAQDAHKGHDHDKKPAQAGAPAGMPPAPQPGPEHELLKKLAGTWDATVESWMAPGAAPSVSKGTETATLTLNGMWLVTDFKSEFMGQPFMGHGMLGWDAGKKKYVSTWADTMSSGMATGESTYDPARKTLTEWMEAPDMSGKVGKMKTTTELKDDNTRVFTIYNVGPDGKESPGLRITYKRK